MSDTFKFTGHLAISPPCTSTDTSGNFEISADIAESLALSKRHATVVGLNVDGVESVNMADLTSASLVFIKSTEPVTVHITTTAGSAQVIGGVTFLMLLCEQDPVTVLALQRRAGFLTTCRVVLGAS